MDLPILDSNVLSSLTKKIEGSLKKSTSGAEKPTKIATTRPSATRKSKTQNPSGHTWDGSEKGKKRLHNGQLKQHQQDKDARSHQTNRRRSDNFATDTTSIKSSIHKDNRAKVLPAINDTVFGNHGRVSKLNGKRAGKKEEQNRGVSKNEQTLSNFSKHHTPKDLDSHSPLKHEILTLGGTEDDLVFIEDVESGSEVEGPEKNTMTGLLEKDISRFVKGLGIEKVVRQDRDQSDDEEENTSEQEDLENPNEIALPLRNNAVKQAGKLSRNVKHLVFEPLSEWHAAQLPPMPKPVKASSLPAQDLLDRIHTYAKQLLDEENNQYALHNRASSSAHQFYSTIMTSGTLSDKISALTLSVQESPVHNMKALESLVALAKKRSRTQAVEVLGALKDLLGQGSLLPSDRRLRAFNTQPGISAFSAADYEEWESDQPLPRPLQKAHLISWAYEDWLKTSYFEILKILETWCNDEIPFARGKAVDYVYELLRDKPEQEANLLRLLVNKLGDSDKKIASKTSYNIIQLETTHPLMKPTIINAIESDLLFRPGQSMHAKYYAVITLNQTVLSGKEEAVARKVLDIYFSLFSALLAKPEPAKPVLSTAKVVTFNKKGEKQGGGGTAGKKAQKKLEMQAKNLTVDEELREKMLSAILTGVNRALPYTKTDDEFFEKHLDTLFRVTHSSNMNTSIQALMLIQQVYGTHQVASDRFYRTLYESLLDPRLLTSSKHAMYLNLLYRALRADLKVKRLKAFAKRLLQVVAMHQPPFVCGVIYLLRELEGVFPNLQSFVDQPEEDESDEEEVFRDVGEDEEVDEPARAVSNQSGKATKSQSYDGRKREPEYSNADKSCLWELDPFLKHFHPSVSLFASKLLTHKPMPEKPDLASHTLIHFLDRFVYRNPKKVAAGPRGASIMQPLAGGDSSGLLVTAQSKKGIQAPVNTEAFSKMSAEKVEPDEVFFHRYFNSVGRGKGRKVQKKEKDGEEDGEDEEEIWKALVDSRPELEGSESGEDVDMDDLESEVEGSGDEGLSDADVADSQGVAIDSGEDDDDERMDFDDDDDDAFLGSDDDVPSDFDEAFTKEVQLVAKEKETGLESEKPRQKRRRLKNLPTFASVEDYAAMLGGSDEGEDGWRDSGKAGFR